MALTRQQMADFFAKEMLDDLDQFVEASRKFAERWCQYGAQYKDDLSLEMRMELDRRAGLALSALKNIGDG